MQVSFYATLRQITGQKTVEVALPDGATVGQLVQAVLQQYPRLRPQMVDENGNLYAHVHVFINGRDAQFTDDLLDTRLNASDRVDIFPAVGGGTR